MVQLQWHTGMRPGEVRIMRTIDMDTSGRIWEYRPSQYKGIHLESDHERVVALGPKAQQILAPWLRTDLEAFLFQPAEAYAEYLAARSAARTTPLSCGNRPGSNRARCPRVRPGLCYAKGSYEIFVGGPSALKGR